MAAYDEVQDYFLTDESSCSKCALDFERKTANQHMKMQGFQSVSGVAIGCISNCICALVFTVIQLYFERPKKPRVITPKLVMVDLSQ